MMTQIDPSDRSTLCTFSPDDWIVHRHYGIGQIKAVETKAIGEEETTYYKIAAHNDSTIWVPIGNEEALLRRAASKDEFAEVVLVLQRPSRKMNAQFQTRLARIRKVSREGNPVMLARTVRDLWARRSRRGQLSNTEETAWRRLVDRLIAEWSVSMGLDETQANQKLYSLLERHALPSVAAA
ncbi:MAG: CarD family transcriptional regulator [Chloroflexota bacterium]